MLYNCARSVWIAVRLRDLIQIIPNDIVSDILRKVFDTCTKKQTMMITLFC